MDKLQALKETRDLWTKIGEETEKGNTVVEKRDIPGPWEEYKEGCPCCEYIVQNDFDCDKCPMRNGWGFTDGEISHYCGTVSTSPYLQWCSYDILCIDSAFWAFLIAELAQEAIDEMREDKK